MSEISDKAQQELLSWPRVTMHNPRFGGVEFCINRMEIEHLYGDQLADLPFPKDVGRKLIEEAHASPPLHSAGILTANIFFVRIILLHIAVIGMLLEYFAATSLTR
jgi:Family of unknown function (DUF5519)